MERRESRLSRRQFVLGAGGLGLVAGCGRLPWQAQGPPRVPRLGVLSPGAPHGASVALEGFRAGLRELGWLEGQNLTIEYRFADTHAERLPALATELVNAQVDVIVASGAHTVSIVKHTTSTVPVVMLAAADPVGTGLVASLARPGGNITGMTETAPGLSGKRLELLKESSPGASRIAVLWNPTEESSPPLFAEAQVAAQILGVQLVPAPVESAHEFDGAFESIRRERVDALLIVGGPLFTGNFLSITDFALRNGLPTITGRREFAEAGGLMAYGTSFADLARRAATLVDKILKGTKPADLPVEQPMRFEFVVNLKTAAALGITFPNEIMLQVTEVIQ
jgi:putative ABC transport system substrate-binding protein